MQAQQSFSELKLDRDRESFLLSLITELGSTLEDVVGLQEAEGFVSIVGRRIGEIMNEDYQSFTDNKKLSLQQVADALVDLKARINGGFTVESMDSEKIVLVNTDCPFGNLVKGRKSLCMMTTNVFGRIAADNLGYSRVEIPESIAAGDSRCRVIVHLKLSQGATQKEGIEFYG